MPFRKPKKPSLVPFGLRRVEGASMWPALQPGTLILTRRWFWRLQPGDVIIFRHQGLEKVKRIQKIERQQVFVTGDNPELSTDSRHFGWVQRKQVVAKVWHH